MASLGKRESRDKERQSREEPGKQPSYAGYENCELLLQDMSLCSELSFRDQIPFLMRPFSSGGRKFKNFQFCNIHIIPSVIQTSVNFTIFNLHFLS